MLNPVGAKVASQFRGAGYHTKVGRNRRDQTVCAQKQGNVARCVPDLDSHTSDSDGLSGSFQNGQITLLVRQQAPRSGSIQAITEIAQTGHYVFPVVQSTIHGSGNYGDIGVLTGNAVDALRRSHN